MADDNSQANNKLPIFVIGMGTAAFVVTIYHYIVVGWCNRQRSNPSTPPGRPFMPEIVELPSKSIQISTTQLVPARKYENGMGLVGEDSTCAICLCEFEEGEELRTLPECLHSYHAPCIDMWLHSHSNCPMCRTDAPVLSSQILQPPQPPPPPLPLPPLRPEFGSRSLRVNTAFHISYTLM